MRTQIERVLPTGRALPVGLAGAGLFAVVVGIHAELLHARPMYDFAITTGWGVVPGHRRWIHSLNHEEWLLAEIAGLALLGSLAATRWRRAAAIPALAGLIVCFYPIRAVAHYATEEGVYTGLPAVGDPTSRVVLGAEPFLLVLGGLCLLGAGYVGWRAPALSSAQTDRGRPAS